MAKLPVRLFVLIVLGTISSCEAVGPPPDSAAVITATSASLLGCAKPETVNVSFNKLKVRGTDSDVVYQRMTVWPEHILFAANVTVNLTSTDIGQCAKAVTSEGLNAFEFNGNCTGYLLTEQFIECQTGSRVLFVLLDYITDEVVVIPFDEAPYKLVNLDYLNNSRIDGPIRLYMLSALVENNMDYLFYPKPRQSWFAKGYESISVEEEVTYDVEHAAFDLEFCYTDGAYGLPMYFSEDFIKMDPLVFYFLNDCGKTIRVPDKKGRKFIYSHEGFGCKYFPSDAPDECTVTYELDRPRWAGLYFWIHYEDEDYKCLFNATVTNFKTDGESSTKDPCTNMNTSVSKDVDLRDSIFISSVRSYILTYLQT
ncbi:hypothetical protein FHG87_012396 [Trinorchestia longiramus]|nr:hypothetical protein FHG87_012396 [Trinorchestia longiramus]